MTKLSVELCFEDVRGLSIYPGDVNEDEYLIID